MQAVFTKYFPSKVTMARCVLDFHSYEIGEPKVDWLECLREGLTYGGAPLCVTFLLKDEGQQGRKKVFMGEFPLDDAARTRSSSMARNASSFQPVHIARRASRLKRPASRTARCFQLPRHPGSWFVV